MSALSLSNHHIMYLNKRSLTAIILKQNITDKNGCTKVMLKGGSYKNYIITITITGSKPVLPFLTQIYPPQEAIKAQGLII